MPQVQVQRHEIPILTTFEPPPGYAIERIVGPCWGITVRSRSIVGTTCAGCQTVFGGEITMFTDLAMSTRNEAMNRLEVTARHMAATASWGCASTLPSSCKTPTRLWPTGPPPSSARSR